MMQKEEKGGGGGGGEEEEEEEEGRKDRWSQKKRERYSRQCVGIVVYRGVPLRILARGIDDGSQVSSQLLAYVVSMASYVQYTVQ